MDGENNGTPYKQMDDLGGKTHYFRKHPYSHFIGGEIEFHVINNIA